MQRWFFFSQISVEPTLLQNCSTVFLANVSFVYNLQLERGDGQSSIFFDVTLHYPCVPHVSAKCRLRNYIDEGICKWWFSNSSSNDRTIIRRQIIWVDDSLTCHRLTLINPVSADADKPVFNNVPKLIEANHFFNRKSSQRTFISNFSKR